MSRYQKLSANLTTRQLEVLLCVLAGDSNAQIARYLAVSPSSVSRCVAQLLKACGARCRTELTSYWADRVFVEPFMEAAE